MTTADNKRDDGGYAFPMAGSCEPSGAAFNYPEYGMSLRDWFAGQALVGLMGDPGMRPSDTREFQHMAARLYQVADAMLAERAKP